MKIPLTLFSHEFDNLAKPIIVIGFPFICEKDKNKTKSLEKIL